MLSNLQVEQLGRQGYKLEKGFDIIIVDLKTESRAKHVSACLQS
jgi:hypothetical protein